MYTLQYLCIEKGGQKSETKLISRKNFQIRPPLSLPKVISIVIVSFFFFSKKWEISIFEFLAVVSQKILLFDTKSVV